MTTIATLLIAELVAVCVILAFVVARMERRCEVLSRRVTQAVSDGDWYRREMNRYRAECSELSRRLCLQQYPEQCGSFGALPDDCSGCEPCDCGSCEPYECTQCGKPDCEGCVP